MRVSMKYAYPEKGTRNGRVYPPEVLEKAFNEPAFKELCSTEALPILSEDNKFIGTGTATLEDKMVVTIDGEIFDSTYIKLLKDFKDSVAFTLAGTGAVEYTDDKAVVTEVDFTHAMFTPCPAVDCKEIQCKD
jgi:hypothetical protein